MIKGILLDLDGVLIRTEGYHYRAWKQVADRLGIPFTPEQGERCRGISRMDSLEIMLENAQHSYSIQEKQALAQEKNRIFQGILNELGPEDIAPQVRSTMEELQRRGYELGLASASRNARLVVDRTGIGGYLDAIADGTCVARTKPDPQVFIVGARLLGLEPRECAAVDDMLIGVQAIKAAGMMAISMGDAARHRAGDHSISRFDQLLELFPGPGREHL